VEKIKGLSEKDLGREERKNQSEKQKKILAETEGGNAGTVPRSVKKKKTHHRRVAGGGATEHPQGMGGASGGGPTDATKPFCWFFALILT